MKYFVFDLPVDRLVQLKSIFAPPLSPRIWRDFRTVCPTPRSAQMRLSPEFLKLRALISIRASAFRLGSGRCWSVPRLGRDHRPIPGASLSQHLRDSAYDTGVEVQLALCRTLHSLTGPTGRRENLAYRRSKKKRATAGPPSSSVWDSG